MRQFAVRTILCLSTVSILGILLSSTGAAFAAEGAAAPVAVANPSQLPRATSGIEAMQSWYDPATGLYKTTGWWNSGNATTVLADYARVSRTTQYNPLLANTFVAAQKTSINFLNDYYDDEGWWALAWIDAYDLTGNPAYLAMAKTIFADMTGGWDNTCGGGIWWSKERKYKAAIANELFLSVAAHLANRDKANSASYLDWANKEWSWFAKTGMINAKNLINDGLTNSDDKDAATSCVNNGRTTWSYNQGVVLGGLVELAKLNPDPTLPESAKKIATATITSLVDAKGILHDPCEPKCGADGTQFKGIFVRNLVDLQLAYPQPAYKSFVDANADAIWTESQGANFQFGEVWTGPFANGNASSQSSALDVIVGAAILQNTK